MLEIVRTLLEASPLLALFLAIATGYAIGQISFAGVSFGAGAVLVHRPDHRCHRAKGGASRDGRNPRPRDVRLRRRHPVRAAVFRQSPRPRHQVHRPRDRRRDRVARSSRWLLAEPLGISLATAAGLFAGSGTSTPTLQAALAAAGNQDPAIGYSVSYPFGVVGPIVLMTIMAALVKPKFDPPVAERAGRRVDPRDRNAEDRDRRRALRRTARRRQDRRCPPESRERAARRRDAICRRATGCCWSAARRASNRPRRRWGTRSQGA